MAEYIDRNDAVKALSDIADYLNDSGNAELGSAINIAANVIKQRPSADVVSVVRCKDCERRDKSADLTISVYCPCFGQKMRKTDFCSCGVRKDGG